MSDRPAKSGSGASGAIAARVREMAERVAQGYGLEIFEVGYRREASGFVLRVQIDRPGPAATPEESVSVEDCTHVSRELSALLDVEDVIPGAFTLEVSSPGLDRPLRGIDDYRRFAGRRAKVVMRAPVDGQGFFKGILAGVDGETVLIDGDDGRPHRVEAGNISRANLEVEF